MMRYSLKLTLCATVLFSGSSFAVYAQELPPGMTQDLPPGTLVGSWGPEIYYTHTATCTGQLGSEGNANVDPPSVIYGWPATRAPDTTVYVQTRVKCVDRDGAPDEWFTINTWQSSDEGFLPFSCGNLGGDPLFVKCRVAEWRP